MRERRRSAMTKIKTCSCGAYLLRIAELEAEVERLKRAVQRHIDAPQRFGPSRPTSSGSSRRGKE